MPACFEIDKSVEGHFYFRLKAANGEIILQSEMYEARSGVRNGIESVQLNAADGKCIVRDRSVDHQYYFCVKAANGEIIGTSEMYETEQGMEKGIASVLKNAAVASTIDLTVDV